MTTTSCVYPMVVGLNTPVIMMLWLTLLCNTPLFVQVSQKCGLTALTESKKWLIINADTKKNKHYGVLLWQVFPTAVVLLMHSRCFVTPYT